MTTKSIGIYSAPAAIRLPELVSERQTSSRPSWISVDFNELTGTGGGGHPPVPRRYEETKQFIVQDYAHHRILKVGHDVHHRLAEEARSQQDQAIKERETKVRQECQRATEKRLVELEKQLALQHEFKMNRLRQEHERIVQEKILETETAMRKDLIEAVEKERDDGKRRLKEKEEELTAWWTAEAERQVKEARNEERAAAARERQRLMQQHEREKVDIRKEEKRLRDEALKKLAEQKDEEMAREVHKAREEERQIREELTQTMQREIDQLTADMDKREAELLEEIEQAEAAHGVTRKKQAAAEDELIKLYQEFETFIDRVLRLNTNGEGAFLLPYTDFLRGIVDARKSDADQEEEAEARQSVLWSRRTSAGTVTLQKAGLPSNVRLITDFT